MYQVTNHTLPRNIQILFRERVGCQRYNLRGKQKLQEQGSRTTLKWMCISVCGVKLWNGLREEVRLCKSLRHFKGIYKKEVLDSYRREELVLNVRGSV